eukprot:114475-Lingulodinium_polyedra.AAC.1
MRLQRGRPQVLLPLTRVLLPRVYVLNVPEVETRTPRNKNSTTPPQHVWEDIASKAVFPRLGDDGMLYVMTWIEKK